MPTKKNVDKSHCDIRERESTAEWATVEVASAGRCYIRRKNFCCKDLGVTLIEKDYKRI